MINKDSYEIIGDNFQAVRFFLKKDDRIFTSPENLLYMSDNIKITSTLEEDTFYKKMLKGLKRILSGGNFIQTAFEAKSGMGEIALSSANQGKIIPLTIGEEGLICEKKAYLCSDETVETEITFAMRIGGKQPFVLQKLSGRGTVFIQASGTVIRKVLSENELIKVFPECILFFDSSVKCNPKHLGMVKTSLWGGIGPFTVTLTGPGNVYIQSMPLNRLCRQILYDKRFGRLSTQD